MAAPYGPARRRGGSVVGPLLLIFLGGIFLLQNTGFLPGNVWTNLWRLWPLVLVLFGLELLLSRRMSWLLAIVGLVVVVFALGVVSTGSTSSAPVATQSFDTQLDGASQAAVTVRFGAGQLSLGPLDAATSGQLASATYDGPSDLGAAPTYTVNGTTGRLEYQLNGRSIPSFPWTDSRGNAPRLDVRLNPAVPLTSLNVQTGATNARLDMSSARLQNVDLSVGAASAWLRLPETGSTTVHVTGGAANVTIEVPDNVAAQVRHTGGLSTFTVDQNRFPQVASGVYRSADYDTNPNRMDITLETGVTTIVVN